MTEIGILGCNGRMGQLLCAEVLHREGLVLTGGCDRTKTENRDFKFFAAAEDLFAVSEIIIDFTSPCSSVENARLAAETGTALLIGTTGLNENQIAEIKKSAESVAILLSANTSLGVNLLIQMTKKIAALLGNDYAIEILEAHHKHKVDAPSGTALALGQAAADGRGIDFETHKALDRGGERKKDDIGFATLRGGNVVGEHTVFFYGEGERLELTHRATDRRLFGKGAIAAATWLVKQQPGFYTMDDFIKLF